MKKLFLFLFLFSSKLNAQQAYLDIGKSTTKFIYDDSKGARLKNLEPTSHSYMAVGYRNRLFNAKKLKGLVGIRYSGYGAYGSDKTLGNIYKWDLNLIELNLGLEYKIMNIKRASLFVKEISTIEYVIQGTQTINNKIYNLKGIEEFNKPMFDFKLGIGFLQPLSEKVSFYVQYSAGTSLAGSNNPEKLRMVSKNITFGLIAYSINSIRRKIKD